MGSSKDKVGLNSLEKLPSQDDENEKEITLKTTNITEGDKLFFKSNNDVGRKQTFWIRNKRIIICSIFLLVLLILFLRVPFVGSYLDAFVFDYLWGFTKYFVYLWMMSLCVIAMFKPGFIRTLAKPKLIVAQFLMVFAISLIFSSISHWANPTTSFAPNSGYFSTLISNYHNNHFLPYIQPSAQVNYIYSTKSTWWANTYYNTGSNVIVFICGGFIGEFFVGLGYLFIIIFGIFVVLLAIISIITSRSEKAALAISKFFSKLFSNKRNRLKFDELGVEKNDISIDAIDNEEIRKEAENLDTPPIRFLTDTSIDNYAINRGIAENVSDGIKQLGIKLNIQLKHVKTIVMPLYSEVAYKVARTDVIKKILDNQVELSNLTKLKEFNISIKGNIIKVEYANKVASKVSIKSILSTHNVSKNAGNLLLGICPDNKALFLNLFKQPSILIAGTKGSGASMLLSNMLCTYAYLNRPDNKFAILAKNDNAILANFNNLPHTDYVAKVDYTTNNVSDILHDFSDAIDRRLDVYKSLEIDDFDQYNKYCKKVHQKPEERKTLVFCDFNEVVANNYEYTSLIQKILLNGYRCGIYIIILTNFVNEEVLQAPIYKNINTKIILRLSSEKESLALFESHRGIQLFGNGDGYIYGKSPDEKLRFQSCYLNQDELSQISEIINNFYKK
ncbi:MAG: hypothetical protein HUJ52_01795 [Malacoplasma sp.]|nr:hypothetical protein [Malacoplasma sp.]